MKLPATDMNPVEHQFVPQTVVAYHPAAELSLLSPDGVVKQSPAQRRGHRTQDLYRNQQKCTKTRFKNTTDRRVMVLDTTVDVYFLTLS